MSGVAAAAIAGVIFGLFQVVNRAALVEMDVLASTFIQLLASSAFMVVALLVQGTEGISSLSASAAANFTLAGLIHFLGGWTLLNMSQKRLGAAKTSPLLATTPLFGTFLAATVAFGVVVVAGRHGASLVSSSRNVLAWKVVAGLLVGLATWSRWYALGLASVAAVLGLGLLTVPTVMVLAPVVSGKHLERITVPVVVGSAFVVAGALVLIFRG